MANANGLANFIWSVADLLRGDYKQSDYGKVILPFTVLRRLDCVLEPTKQKVLDSLPKVQSMNIQNIDPLLNNVAGFPFHNRSQSFNCVQLYYTRIPLFLHAQPVAPSPGDPPSIVAGVRTASLAPILRGSRLDTPPS